MFFRNDVSSDRVDWLWRSWLAATSLPTLSTRPVPVSARRFLSAGMQGPAGSRAHRSLRRWALAGRSGADAHPGSRLRGGGDLADSRISPFGRRRSAGEAAAPAPGRCSLGRKVTKCNFIRAAARSCLICGGYQRIDSLGFINSEGSHFKIRQELC
jgi:hypothetical protein